MNLPSLHFKDPRKDALKGRGRGELVALFWILLFSPAIASAMDLFSFRYQGKILAFAVPSSDPVTASVKDNAAETTALNWAVRFYGAQDIDREEIELRTAPTRFWLVRLRANAGATYKMLYAVVLPNGSIVEPTVREQL
jgi:hypothetical protein